MRCSLLAPIAACLGTGALALACSAADPALPPSVANAATAEAGAPAAHDPGGPAAPAAPPPATHEARVEPDYFGSLPRNAAQLKVLCERKGQDTVSLAFCKAKAPELHGIGDLLTTLGLGFKDRTKGNATGGNPGFAVTGHSSSLVVRTVTAANPRAVVFTPPIAGRPNPSYVALGYTRGEQLVELATRDPETGEPAFYLLRYEQPCNATKSCTPADLHGPAAESGWTGWTLYEDEDLANTPMDCLRCHQPNAKAAPFLRLQERTAPFTHWFSTATEGGRALLADYHEVHGHGEDWGPIPAALVDASDPALLAKFVDQNNGAILQPNAYDSAVIEAEVRRSAPEQPTFDDSGKSAAWLTLFDVAARGDAIRVPYHDVKVTSDARLAEYARSYRPLLADRQASPALTDARDLFLEAATIDMGLRPRPGTSGEAIVKQMCSECHNGRLDQGLSRARFDATRFREMSAGERQAARERLDLPDGDPRRMPPAVFGTLGDADKSLVREALK